jgi:Domain of unknown function (DUF1772)
MTSALLWIQTASTALFALWALYISLVEHPARIKAGPAAGLAQWRSSYPRAAPWQASAAALACLSGLCASVVTGRWAWAVAALLVGGLIPFTLIAVMPTNRRLEDPDLAAPGAAPLLLRWGRLHWIRTLVGMLALAVLVVESHRR